ncbi:DNA-directed RNA polymerase I subunit RPA12 [Escovopsis weberi]|uniref:DNA-directed RNA polymerase I subunit RPA12 n=1 Tax=Escovopsis weberi TaxID=150374 RepID=A0A0M9VSC4_ESCWE|nr:DNA-directed RNA polymerase I subunit RPA12 [Escovopsis weberi]
MAAIGSLVFCTDCGNLLPASLGNAHNILTCECCGAENKDTGSTRIVTKSKPSDFPSLLRQKLQSNVQRVERHNVKTDSTVTERCPKCGREEVTYTNVQLRSADEGSTIIYMCQCGYSYALSRLPSPVSRLPSPVFRTAAFKGYSVFKN